MTTNVIEITGLSFLPFLLRKNKVQGTTYLWLIKRGRGTFMNGLWQIKGIQIVGLILLIMLLWQPPPITFIPLRYWTDERSKNPFDFFYSYVMLNRSCNIHIMKCRFSAASLSLIFLERRSYFFLLLDIFVHQFDSKIVFRVYDNSRFPKEVFLASILHHKASKFTL